jgi:hypothetical protein
MGSKLSNFKIEDENCKMVKIRDQKCDETKIKKKMKISRKQK